MFSAVDIEDNFRTMVQQVTSYYSDAFAVKKTKKTQKKKRFIQSKGNSMENNRDNFSACRRKLILLS